MSQTPDSNQPVVYEPLVDEGFVYEIRIAGHLPARWSAWFEGLAVAPEPDGTTLLSGPVADQAALYGLLKRVRDTGLTLIAVNQIPSQQEQT
jgi:hypothetical protein